MTDLSHVFPHHSACCCVLPFSLLTLYSFRNAVPLPPYFTPEQALVLGKDSLREIALLALFKCVNTCFSILRIEDDASSTLHIEPPPPRFQQPSTFFLASPLVVFLFFS